MPGRKRPVSPQAADKHAIARAPSFDPVALTPNDLRDRVRHALASLTEEDRKATCDRLLAGLAGAGVNVRSSIMALGILARRTDELTPPDMGQLLRYVRINFPAAIAALAEPLKPLFLHSAPAPVSEARRINKAA